MIGRRIEHIVEALELKSAEQIWNKTSPSRSHVRPYIGDRPNDGDLREPPPEAGEVPRLRLADDLQLDTGCRKAGGPGVEEALEAFALGQPVEASEDDRASRQVRSDGTTRTRGPS
jgi:hypothetical protein